MGVDHTTNNIGLLLVILNLAIWLLWSILTRCILLYLTSVGKLWTGCMIYSFTGGVGIYLYTSLYRVRSHKGAPGFQMNIIIEWSFPLPGKWMQSYYIQIYHAWQGYLRKIPVERRTISRAEWRGKFSVKTGIFRKYPSQTWYICLITPNII